MEIDKKSRVIRATPLWRRLIDFALISVAIGVAGYAIFRVIAYLGLPGWSTVLVVIVCGLSVLVAAKGIGISRYTWWLTRHGFTARQAMALTAGWKINFEDSHVYAVTRRGDTVRHLYPRPLFWTATPSGVYVTVRLPSGGLTGVDLEAKAPALSVAFGIPVAVFADDRDPSTIEIHFRLRDPLDGVRTIGEN